MKHALLSPSSAHRWLACPGSVQANSDKPWEQNFYALQGTTAHALLETCLRLDADPASFEGQVIEEGHMPIDEEMVDAVGYAIDWTRAYMANNPKAVLRIEQPVYPAALLGTKKGVLWGTPDIQISNYPIEVVTLDYKHGVGIPVSVKDNPQIKIYHLGARAEFGAYRRYRSVVVQPRVPKRRPVQEATLTDAELMKWADKTVAPVIPVALSSEAPRNAGDWCRYCAASGRCPAQMTQKLEKASEEFGKAKTGKKLTPKETARYLDMLPSLQIAIDALYQAATHDIHNGISIPGYTASWSVPRRAWRDADEANQVLESMGLEKRERFEVTLLSPSKAEKALQAKGKIARKKRGEPRVPSPLKDYVVYTEQKPTISKFVEPDAVG